MLRGPCGDTTCRCWDGTSGSCLPEGPQASLTWRQLSLSRLPRLTRERQVTRPRTQGKTGSIPEARVCLGTCGYTSQTTTGNLTQNKPFPSEGENTPPSRHLICTGAPPPLVRAGPWGGTPPAAPTCGQADDASVQGSPSRTSAGPQRPKPFKGVSTRLPLDPRLGQAREARALGQRLPALPSPELSPQRAGGAESPAGGRQVA